MECKDGEARMRLIWEYEDIVSGLIIQNDQYKNVVVGYDAEIEKYLLVNLDSGFVIVSDMDRYQLVEKLNEYRYKVK